MKTTLLTLLVLSSIMNCYSQTSEEFFKSGLSKHNIKDYKGAISDYSKAIEINPNIVDAYKNRGISKTRLMDYKGAIDDFSTQIKKTPDDADAFYNRGISKIFFKEKEGGCLDLNKASELGHEKADIAIKRNCN